MSSYKIMPPKIIKMGWINNSCTFSFPQIDKITKCWIYLVLSLFSLYIVSSLQLIFWQYKLRLWRHLYSFHQYLKKQLKSERLHFLYPPIRPNNWNIAFIFNHLIPDSLFSLYIVSSLQSIFWQQTLFSLIIYFQMLTSNLFTRWCAFISAQFI